MGNNNSKEPTLKDFLRRSKVAKQYISDQLGITDKREQNNYLKIWASSGMPNIKASGRHQAWFDAETNTMNFGDERYNEKDEYGSYSSKEDEKKRKAKSFVEELAHARQYKSMRSPFREHEDKDIREYEKKGNLGFDIPFSAIAGTINALGLNALKNSGKENRNLLKGALPLSALSFVLNRYGMKKDNRANSDIMEESFHKADLDLNIKSVQSDTELLESMPKHHRKGYEEGTLTRHWDEYYSPWTTESMAHTQLDPREGNKIDNYSGEKDTRSISDMIRGELDILSKGDDNYLNKAFQNFKWLVENTKNTTKVNKVMGTKWKNDKSGDVRRFVGEALRYAK